VLTFVEKRKSFCILNGGGFTVPGREIGCQEMLEMKDIVRKMEEQAKKDLIGRCGRRSSCSNLSGGGSFLRGKCEPGEHCFFQDTIQDH